jgi:catechol 2,3-dioxygenase-like lactoylglutathione lyase family enzyme
MTTRPRLRAVTPLLVVSDLKRSVDFYCKMLGFVDPNVHGDPPCFAMMNRDGFDLMLSLGEKPEHVRPHGPHGTWEFYVSVADVAAEIAALESAGTRVDKGPTDTFYGMREIEVVDPDGHRICFGQDVGDEPLRVAEIYEGVLDLGAAKLRLVLKLAPSEDGLVGRLDSPDQGAMNLPIDSVTREGSSLRFEMKSIGAAYEGRLASDGSAISGRWSQRGRDSALEFRRV